MYDRRNTSAGRATFHFVIISEMADVNQGDLIFCQFYTLSKGVVTRFNTLKRDI